MFKSNNILFYICTVLCFILSFIVLFKDFKLFFIAAVILTINMLGYWKREKIDNWLEKEYVFILSIILLLMLNIPFSASFVDKFSENKNAELMIEALNTKNPESKNTEIWVDAINIDGNNIDLNLFKKTNPKWHVSGRMNYHDDKKSIYKIIVKPKKSISISFVKQAYSGECKLTINNYSNTIDLYSNTDEIISIDLTPYMIKEKKLTYYFYLLLFILFLYLFLKEIIFRILKYLQPVNNIKIECTWFTYGSICLLIWGIYYFAFYPGLFSGDTVDQWYQMSVSTFNDWHPAIHTLLLKLITSLTKTPAVIPFLQILTTSYMIGKFMRLFYEKGISNKILIPVAAVIAFFPANAIMLLNIWKDIPYSISVLVLTYIVSA